MTAWPPRWARPGWPGRWPRPRARRPARCPTPIRGSATGSAAGQRRRSRSPPILPPEEPEGERGRAGRRDGPGPCPGRDHRHRVRRPGAAIALRRSGRRDFVILERADSVGGTWRDNTYPGCACDVPSHLYSFSFAPNPAWSRSFSPQPEIRRYLEDVTDRYGLRRHIRFGTEVTEARWDAGAARWRLSTSRGALSADVLVSAAGPLSAPRCPTSRAWTRSPARSSTRRAGTTTTTWRASGSRWSARGRRPSRSCPRSSPRSAS